MTTLEPRIESRLSAVRGLAALWVVFTVVFTYLDVPLWNSTLFAVNLVLQASLGGFVITRLLNGLPLTLLLFCGPGLILGGALSFFVFQIAGRGTIGALSTTLVALLATISVVRSSASQWAASPRWWILSQIVGIASLGMSHEFSELVPLAIALFILGLTSSGSGTSRRIFTASAGLFGAMLVITSKIARAKFWWLVTDDYQLFEVISRHLTIQGPFANWGATSFTQYHWLSYGWAGELSFMSGDPAPFVTLTRVMPFAYSLALAASLAMVHSLFNNLKFSTLGFSQVWALVAVTKLDWAGTSTAGSYAVLAALTYFVMQRLKNRAITGSYAVIGVFAGILVLTKITSIFALLLLLGFVGAQRFHSEVQRPKVRKVGYLIILVIVTLGLFVIIHVASKILGGSFRFVYVNGQLGQLAWFGPWFAGLALVLKQVYLLIPIAVALKETKGRFRKVPPKLAWYGCLGVLALACGVVLDVTITANSDNHKYLSGPFYFLAGISFLIPSIEQFESPSQKTLSKSSTILVSTIVTWGFLWSHFRPGSYALDRLAHFFLGEPSLAVELIKFVSSDSRFGAGLFTAVLLTATLRCNHRHPGIFLAFTLGITFLTFGINGLEANGEFSRKPSEEEVRAYIGSSSEQVVGEWLKNHVARNDLIATNHLFGISGGTVSDLGLAVWSGRQFLVLGPSLGDRRTTERSDAIRLSIEFADHPTRDTCSQLLELGVSWFVVDTQLTSQRNWSTCSSKMYQSTYFIVLRLSISDLAPSNWES